MERRNQLLVQTLAMLVLMAVTLPSAGCVGLWANLLYQGRMAPAAYPGLVGERVAVVCVAQSGDFGPNPSARLIAQRVTERLQRNVHKIQTISHQKIEAWQDEHDTDVVDYLEIGRGVKADKVVAIDIEQFRLQDNQTLYKGNAELQVRVYDVASGQEEYAPFITPIIYPKISGLHTASVSKRQFQRKFIEIVSTDVAKHFYPYDLNQEIARDTPDLGQ